MLSSFQLVYGQFEGSKGSGYSTDFINYTTCRIFSGEKANGFSHAQTTGRSVCDNYGGGNFSGSDSDYKPSPHQCLTFYGENKSGFIEGIWETEHNCNAFYGEKFSGYDLDQYQTAHNCNAYYGEKFSGYYVQEYQSTRFNCYPYGSSPQFGGGFHVSFVDFCSKPLGVESSPLFGKVIERKTGRLHWKTFSEEDNAGFEIQKTLDGENWTVIGWVEGNGNSSVENKYEFIYDSLTSEIQYFRYKQIDFDGDISYSNVVSLSIDDQKESQQYFVAYPNPNPEDGTLKLRAWITEQSDVNITVIDLSGRIIHSDQHRFNSSEDVYYFPTAYFSAGTYYLKLELLNTNESVSLPFVVFK